MLGWLTLPKQGRAPCGQSPRGLGSAFPAARTVPGPSIDAGPESARPWEAADPACTSAEGTAAKPSAPAIPMGSLPSRPRHAPAEHGDLILHQGFLAPEGILGDALEGHEVCRAPLLGQHHLREGTPVAQPDGGHREVQVQTGWGGLGERQVGSGKGSPLCPRPPTPALGHTHATGTSHSHACGHTHEPSFSRSS